jgi:hypothetical protein
MGGWRRVIETGYPQLAVFEAIEGIRVNRGAGRPVQTTISETALGAAGTRGAPRLENVRS